MHVRFFLDKFCILKEYHIVDKCFNVLSMLFYETKYIIIILLIINIIMFCACACFFYTFTVYDLVKYTLQYVTCVG